MQPCRVGQPDGRAAGRLGGARRAAPRPHPMSSRAMRSRRVLPAMKHQRHFFALHMEVSPCTTNVPEPVGCFHSKSSIVAS